MTGIDTTDPAAVDGLDPIGRLRVVHEPEALGSVQPSIALAGLTPICPGGPAGSPF